MWWKDGPEAFAEALRTSVEQLPSSSWGILVVKYAERRSLVKIKKKSIILYGWNNCQLSQAAAAAAAACRTRGCRQVDILHRIGLQLVINVPVCVQETAW